MAVNKADYYDERDKRNLTVKTTTPSPVKTTTANKAVTYNGTTTTPVKTNTPSVNKPATLSKILADNPNPSVNVKRKPNENYPQLVARLLPDLTDTQKATVIDIVKAAYIDGSTTMSDIINTTTRNSKTK